MVEAMLGYGCIVCRWFACVNDSTSGVDFFTPGVKVYTQLAVSGKRS